MKIPFAHLRDLGYLSVVYVDDSYLQGNDFEECLKNVIETINILRFLGYTIHAEKSALKVWSKREKPKDGIPSRDASIAADKVPE